MSDIKLKFVKGSQSGFGDFQSIYGDYDDINKEYKFIRLYKDFMKKYRNNEISLDEVIHKINNIIDKKHLTGISVHYFHTDELYLSYNI